MSTTLLSETRLSFHLCHEGASLSYFVLLPTFIQVHKTMMIGTKDIFTVNMKVTNNLLRDKQNQQNSNDLCVFPTCAFLSEPLCVEAFVREHGELEMLKTLMPYI